MTRKFAGFSAEGSDSVTTPDTLVAKVKREPRFFSEGLHTVKIVSVDEKGPVSTDNSWERLWVKVEGTGERSTYTGISFPTESLMFKGEPNSYMAQQFLALVKALGYSTSPSELPGVMAKLFSDTSKLVGLELQVQVGYKGNHLVLQDKKLHVVQKYGNRPVLKDGQPAVFSEREEAYEWAASSKLEIQKFPEIVAFVASTTHKSVAPIKRAETGKAAAF